MVERIHYSVSLCFYLLGEKMEREREMHQNPLLIFDLCPFPPPIIDRWLRVTLIILRGPVLFRALYQNPPLICCDSRFSTTVVIIRF